MKQPNRFHTLLIFPPVWTPVTPYLALPLLVAYLRKKGFSVAQYDAGLAFFDGFLLMPDTLSRLLETISSRKEGGHYDSLPRDKRHLLEDVMENRRRWEHEIGHIRDRVEALRHEVDFYDPGACIRAQQGIYDLLGLASLAFNPTAFTFNTFSNPKHIGFQEMAAFCNDPTENPFLAFYTRCLPEIMEAHSPSLVGISISTSHQLGGALSMARFIKGRYPAVHVTLGGKHCLRLMESFFESPDDFSRFCDSMIMGNGERPLENLIRRLEAGGDLGNVPNLIHCQGGRLQSNETISHEPIGDLPTPDFSDLPLKSYYSPEAILPMRLSEGCYWGKCTFCSRYDNRRFQTVPPEVAADQMEALHRQYGTNCFTINDDCLTPTYLEDLSRIIIARGLSPRISLWCKPVHSFNKDRLALLYRAGVRLVRWGVETGHPRILKLMNKGTRLESTIQVLKDASDVGIWNHATIIFGFPGETEEEAQTTLRFIEAHRDIIHSAIFFRFVLLKYSHIAQHPAAFDIISVGRPAGPFSYDHPFTCAKGMNDRELTRFLARAQAYRIRGIYGHPFWFYLRIREYLLLYTSRYGLQTVSQWGVDPKILTVTEPGHDVTYHFHRPEDMSQDMLDAIRELIESGGEVGVSWIQRNLKNACMVAHAVSEGKVVGVMIHKRPLPEYVREIERKTKLNLRGYLERGYTYVKPAYRGRLVGDRMLKGLVERSPGEKIYVTIRMDNEPAVRLTLRNRMRLAASFNNERTGHDIGVYINQ